MTVPWTDLIWCFGGAALIWLLNNINNHFAHRKKAKTDGDTEIQRLAGAVRRHSFLIEAGAERQAMHARGSILLANAVKTGDQGQVTKALDLITVSETQYLSSITARMTRDDQVPDAEEAPNA
jgi:hypothetical protein